MENAVKNSNELIAGKIEAKREIVSKILKGSIYVFVLFLVVVVVTIISQYKKVSANRDKINSEWPTYRCKPYIMPFAGWLVGPPGVSGVGNFVECGLLIFKNSFLRFMTPIFAFLDKLLNIILDIVRSIENLRKMVNYLRNSIESFLVDIGNMLYGYGKKLSYLFNRLLKTFGLIFDTFYYLFYTLAYAIYTVAAVWNSPIGGVARYFHCFPGSTMIKTKKGLKPISHLDVGEEILDGKILAVFKMDGKDTCFYRYPSQNNVFVTGDHLVEEDGRWIRVADSRAEPTKIEDKEIYCLVTESGQITVDNIRFSDYQEGSSEDFKIIQRVILQHLNNNTESWYGSGKKVWGLGKNTKILLADGTMKDLKDIKIGERILDGGLVRGLVKIDKNIDQYLYEDVVCSGDLIVQENGRWVQVKDISTKVVENREHLYHLLTEHSIMRTNRFTSTDFDQTLDPALNAKIDRWVENNLDKKE